MGWSGAALSGGGGLVEGGAVTVPAEGAGVGADEIVTVSGNRIIYRDLASF